MAIVQLAGYGAFIVASLVLGLRLISLWRRTREWPELTIGLAFLLSGCLGYTAWLGIGVLIAAEAPSEAIKLVAGTGLAFTILGALCNGLGTAMIFRAGRVWAWALIACAGLAMIASWSAYVVSPAGESTPAFWLTVLLVSPLYLWGAVEAISLGLVLRKRARLGLSDPLVADRTMQFGISGAAVVASIGISWTAQFIYGAPPPVWTATLASCALLVGAGGIWLGFFPPAAYRARVESSLGAE